MANYGPNPWQRGLPKSSDLIRKVVEGQRARVYDNPIAPPAPAPMASGELNAAPPGFTPEPESTGSWLLDTGMRMFNNYVNREPAREYPGSWGTPEQYQRSQSNTLIGDEASRFGAAGIAQQNRAEEASHGYLRAAGQRPYGPPGRPLPGIKRSEPGVATITPADARALLPLSSNMGWSSKQDFVISNYPNLFAAAQQAGLDSDDTFDVVNLTLAVDAARTIAGTVNEVRQRQLLMTMPKPQRALVLDILGAMAADAQRNDAQVTTGSEVAQVNADPSLTARTNAGDEQNPVLKWAGDKLWSPSVNISGLPFVYPDTDWGPIQGGELYVGAKGVFDSLVAANEMMIRGTNTAMLRDAYGGWENAWNATAAGQYDPEMIRTIKANNDPLLVDVMLYIKQLAAREDDDPVGAILERFGGNQQALIYADQILLNVDPQSDLSKLANEIDVAESSNIGNVAGWSLAMGMGLADAGTYEGIESFADSTITRGGSKLTNISLTFLLDPTIFGSKVKALRDVRKYGLVESPLAAGLPGTRAFREARLGLAGVAPGRIDQVFSTRAVQNYFNYLGSQLDKIRTMDDVAEQAQVFNSVASQNRRWFTTDALKVMLDAGVTDAASAKAFFDDAENIQFLLTGQAGRRSRKFIVPHMTVAYATTKATMLGLRGINRRVMGSRGYVDAVFGPGTSAMMPEEAANHLAEVIEKDPQAVGRALSDFVYVDEGGAVRTVMGRIVDRLDGTDRALPAPSASDELDPNAYRYRDRYGWRREGLVTGNVRAALDRLGRLMAHMPDASRGIPVSGPEGAEMVKELAQGLGMSRYFANYLRYIWPTLTEPQRVRLVNGLNRTGIITSGIDLVNPALADSLMNTYAAVATRTATQYTASYVDMIRIRANAERVVEKMDRARKAQNRAAMTPVEREAAIQDEVERILDEVETAQTPTVAPAPAVGDEVEPIASPEPQAPTPATAVEEVDDVADEAVEDAPPLTDEQFNDVMSNVMPYADGDEIDDAIEQAIVSREDGDLDQAEYWLRKAYEMADLDWPAPSAAAAEAPPAPAAEVADDLPEGWTYVNGIPASPEEAARYYASRAPAAPAWEPYATPLPERLDPDQQFPFEPGDTVTADEVEGARPDLWIKHTERDGLSRYMVWGRREGEGSDALIVEWDADVIDGGTDVLLFDSTLADQKAAWDFIQRLERTYMVLDVPRSNQVIDDSAEQIARHESRGEPVARVSVGEVPEGTATWRRAGGPHSEPTTLPRGEMSIVATTDVRTNERVYSAMQPTNGVGEGPSISWYAKDGQFIGSTSRGVDKNVVEAMKAAIKKWGDENGVKTPTKWSASTKPRPVDPADVAESAGKKPITAETKPGNMIRAQEVDANGTAWVSRINYPDGGSAMRFSLDHWGNRGREITWDPATGEVLSAPHLITAEGMYPKLLVAADEYDLGVVPTLQQMRDALGDEFGERIGLRVSAENPDILTVSGRPVLPQPTGRLEMPQLEITDWRWRDERPMAGRGYMGEIKIGKNQRKFAVTVRVEEGGDRTFFVVLDKRPTSEYDLEASITFNEYGDIAGGAYGYKGRFQEYESSYTSANGYNKVQYQSLAKVIAQEAAKFDIPIRGELADWLEQMGIKGLQRDPEVWDAEAVFRGMSDKEYDAFAAFLADRDPSLVTDDIVTLADEDGRSAIIAHESPQVRRLLAEYLGRVDDESVEAAAPMRVTQPFDGRKYDGRFTPEGRPLGGSTDGLGTALPDMVPNSAPGVPEVPGVEETIDGLTFRLRVTMRRDSDGEIVYTGISADVAQEGAFGKRGWGGLDAQIDWHPDGRININSPVTESSTGTAAATARQAESIRQLEQWVTDVAETHGLDIDLPWAGYFPRRGDWGYTGDPVDEVVGGAPPLSMGGTESRGGASQSDSPYTYDWDVVTPDNVTDGGDEAYGNATRIHVTSDDGKFAMTAAWAEDGTPIDVYPTKGFRQGVKPSAEEKRASATLLDRLHYAAIDLSHKRPGFKYAAPFGSPGYPELRTNWFSRAFPVEVTERVDVVNAGKTFKVTIARGIGLDGEPAFAVRAVPESGSGASMTNTISDTLTISGRGSIPEGGAYKLRYPPDGEKSGFYGQGSYKKATWEAIAAALVRDGDELGIPIREGVLGFWLDDMGYGAQLRGTFAPVKPPATVAPAPVIDDIVEWRPDVTTPEELAKFTPAGVPGRKTKNPIAAVLKNVDETMPGLQQVAAVGDGLWVTDRYRLLRLSDADAEGIQPGMRVVVVRTKARIEQDMKIAAKVSTTDANYQALEAELQAALDGKALAAVGPLDSQAPKMDTILAKAADTARDGKEFVPDRIIAAETRGTGRGKVTTVPTVSDGVVFFNAKYVADLPKGSIIKYVEPTGPAAVVNESGELIGVIMPIRRELPEEMPAGVIDHPVHGRQEGWRYTDGEGNTYHLYHKVKEQEGVYYQRQEDKPDGPIDYGWWLEMRTKAQGADGMSNAIDISWAPDGTLKTPAGSFNQYGRGVPQEIQDRLAALADRLIDEHKLPLDKVGGGAAAAPTPAAPTKSFKIDKRVYQEFREELGLGEATRETKTLAYVELDHDQFVALVERAQKAGKDADSTMAPGPAAAAKRKYRDAMQSLWDQGAPEAAAVADDAAQAAAAKQDLPLDVLFQGDARVPEGILTGSIDDLGFQEEIDGVLYSIVVDQGGAGTLSVKSYKVRANDPWNKPGDKGDGYGVLMPDASIVFKDGEWVKGGGRMNRDKEPTAEALSRTIAYAEEARQRFDLEGWLTGEKQAPARARAAEVRAQREAERAARQAAPAAEAEPVEMAVADAQTGQPFEATLLRGEGGRTPGGGRQDGTGEDAIAGPAIYVTDDEAMATGYAKDEGTGEVVGEVKSVRVRIENPLVISDPEQWRTIARAMGEDPKPRVYTVDSAGEMVNRRPEIGQKFREYLISRGHDGAIVQIPNPASGDAVADVFGGNTVIQLVGDDVPVPSAPVAPAAPRYTDQVMRGEFDVDLEAGTMTQRAPEPVETTVTPPPNPIPAAAPAEPEVIQGTVVAGGQPPQQPPTGMGAAAAGDPDRVPGLSRREKASIRRGEITQARQLAMQNGEIRNPSSLNETDNYALYDTQLTRTVSILDPAKMNMMMARSSYLNALLGGGDRITTATDWWTLATLAGPRFVMRSGLEDFGLYALTGGQFFGHGGWLDSRHLSMAIRESTERVEPVRKPLLRGNNPGMKLSLAATARREFGTRLAKRVPSLRALVLPYLTEAEVQAATAMATAKGPQRSRQGIANLMATAYARARFFSLARFQWGATGRVQLTGARKEIADIIGEGVERGYLTGNMERASEVAEHLADGTMPAYRVGPGGAEVVDGTQITYVSATVGRGMTRETVEGYSTRWQSGGRNADDIEAFHMELDRSLHQSGYKSYAAIARSRRYYRLRYEVERAVKPETKAKHQQALDQFIDEFAADIANDAELSRYVLVQQLGVRGYAERLLDDALRMMTTADGYYNTRLLDAMLLPNYRRVTVSNELAENLGYTGSTRADVTTITVNRQQWDDALTQATDPADIAALNDAGRPEVIYGRNGAPIERRYGLYYFDEDGTFRFNLDAEDLHNPEIDMPQSIGAADTITVPISDKIPFTSRAWSAMGRSLARLTREPIYLSNYVDSARLVAPFRQRMLDDLIANGKDADEAAEMVADWATKLAADRAYQLTMAYVDNPAIRSQLAWQVRNVARFYRALEDFYRRMVRVAQYEPVAFWKMALAWNVLDDSGFVWEDEFGEKYFMFPGTQAMFTVVNDVLSRFNIQTKVPGLPMAWGARVTMISPSTDPNAMVPTLGSPYAGGTLKGLLRFLPSIGVMSSETGQAVEGALFGEYSPQQTFASALINDVAGPNISRFIDAASVLRGGADARKDESDSMYATAAKQAIHAMAATGLFDPAKDYTNEELDTLRSQADVTALNALYLRLFLTPVLPATPQPVSLTVSDEARALGVDSASGLWLEYLNQYPSYEEAFLAFTRDNPGKAMFTVSKYENTAYYRQLVETEDFIKANQEEFNVRPIGLSHFAPMEGTYSGMSGFYFMRANGIKVPTTVEDYFNSTMQSAGQAEMSYIDMVEEQGSTGVSADQRKLMSEVAAAMRSDVREQFPMTDYGDSIDTDRRRQARRDAEEIVETARYMIRTGQDSDGRAQGYLDAFQVFVDLEEAKALTGKGSAERRTINDTWRLWVTQEGLASLGTDQRGERFLRILSSALDTPVEGL